MRTMTTDKEQIERLGGSAEVARMLGYTVQRVQNWKDRGVPAKVKLTRPDLFPAPKPDVPRRRKTDK